MGPDLGRRAGVGSGDRPTALSLGCVRPLSPPRRYGHSLLIYQHFGRQKHDQFVESQAEELARLGNADRVFAFYDDAAVFLPRSPTRSHGKPRSSEGEGRGQMARIAGRDTSVRGPATPPPGRLGLHAAGRTVLLLHDRIPFHQGFGFCAVVGGYGYGGVVVAPV